MDLSKNIPSELFGLLETLLYSQSQLLAIALLIMLIGRLQPKLCP